MLESVFQYIDSRHQTVLFFCNGWIWDYKFPTLLPMAMYEPIFRKYVDNENYYISDQSTTFGGVIQKLIIKKIKTR